MNSMRSQSYSKFKSKFFGNKFEIKKKRPVGKTNELTSICCSRFCILLMSNSSNSCLLLSDSMLKKIIQNN